MAAPYSLCSPNGLTVIYFVAQTVTGPTFATRVRGVPVPASYEKLMGVNAMTREEKVTLIAKLAEVTLAGEEVGIATGATQAAAEAATPAGSGQLILENLLTAARNWPTQAGGRTRVAGAYPTGGGSTGTGEATLRLGKKDDGTVWEFNGVIEAVTPTYTPKKGDDAQKLRDVTIVFRIGEVLSA